MAMPIPSSPARVPAWRPFPSPGTPGVPESTVRDTLLAPYNDVRAVEGHFHLYGKDIAAIIVGAIAGNMGLVLPEEGFLKALRALCDTHGALLIMDEVITGFRAEYGGAQTRFGITPDLTTLGKIIGGGLPVGAFGGKREYMSRVAPAGDVYQAGTSFRESASPWRGHRHALRAQGQRLRRA